MFAIIRTGGKQYKVQPDQVVTVERLPGEAGDTLSFESVLMVGNGEVSHMGHPFLNDALVKAQLLEQTRAEKIIVFKKKRRHNYRRKQGHRQDQSVLRILEISGPNGLKASGKGGNTSPQSLKKPASPSKGSSAEKISSSVQIKEVSAPSELPKSSSKKSPSKTAL